MMAYETPELGYAYDALEPYIDEATMRVHHDKHHTGYTNKLNAAVEGTEFADKDPAWLVANINKLPENIRTAVRNNGGGHVNHAFFWPLLKKGVQAEGAIIDAINKKWGDIEKFKEEFANAAGSRFGSGWAWLVKNADGSLEIMSTPNQDSPLTQGKIPLLGLDVWEHAYYLKYQNKRPDYVGAFWNIVNWEKVNEHFEE